MSDFVMLAEAGARELVISMNRAKVFVRETKEHVKKCQELIRDIRAALVAAGKAPVLKIRRFSRISDSWAIWENDDMDTFFHVSPSEIVAAINSVLGDELAFDPITGEIEGGSFINDQKEVIEVLWINQYK